MLRERKQLLPQRKAYICGLYHGGNASYADTASRMKVSKSTVRRILKLYEEDRLCERRVGSGRPRETSDRDNNHIVLAVQRNRNITCSEIKDNLGLNVSVSTISRRINESGEISNCWTQQKPWMSNKNRINRLKWCQEHLHWTNEDWQKVL